MLEALGGPGERSILSQKRRTGNGKGGEETDKRLEDGESQEDVFGEVQEKRENDESLGSHVSESMDNFTEAEKREEKDEYEEKRTSMKENSEEEDTSKDKKGE